MVCSDDSPIGTDGSGFDDDHIDAEGFDLHAQGIGEGLEGIFGRIVPCSESERHVSCHAGQIDDTSAMLLTHIRQNLLRHTRQAEDIDLELMFGIGHRHIFDCTEIAVSGIVDEYVDTPFAGDDLLDASRDRRFVGDVQLQCLHTIWRQFFYLLHSPCRAIHTVSLLGKDPCGLVAHSATGACDENYFH